MHSDILQPMIWGTTLSHIQCAALGVDIFDALEQAHRHGLQIIRIPDYWSRPYDARPLIEACARYGMYVVYTVGAKAPRWPEFFIPQQRKIEDVHVHIKSTIERYAPYSTITHWQIENEPLDPSGPQHMTVSLSLLHTEITLARNLDNRPIIGTVWGNDWQHNKASSLLEQLVDIIGVDLYPHQCIGSRRYRGPDTKYFHSHTPLWITELQAEPWEDTPAACIAPAAYSMSKMQCVSHIRYARSLHMPVCLLWGWEWLCKYDFADQWNMGLLLHE